MRNLLLLLFSSMLTGLSAQVPPAAFHYSAVARDAQGAPLAEKAISVQVLVRSGQVMGPVAYEETHEVTTDAFGLFTLVIGGGMMPGGDLNLIDWSADQYYLQIGLDPDGGQNYTMSNATQLLSVPYAMHAKTADSVLTPEYQTLSISNDTLFLTNGGFAKLPPSVLTPSSLIQPVISALSIGNIGSNSAAFQFHAGNIKDFEISNTSIIFSMGPDLFVQSNAISDVSRKSGDQNFSNLYTGHQYSPHHSLLELGLFEAGTTYYIWPRVNTINNISFFGDRDSLTTAPVGYAGPAGGVVFFDKGFHSDGWRYLEMYPEALDTLLPWGCPGTSITGTGSTLGQGPSNTAAILQQCGDPVSAARFCDAFSYGGYDDWFLPSPTELHWALSNLLPLDLGNFEDGDSFWTSQQTGPNGGVIVELGESPSTSHPKEMPLLVRPIRRY